MLISGSMFEYIHFNVANRLSNIQHDTPDNTKRKQANADKPNNPRIPDEPNRNDEPSKYNKPKQKAGS